jgi:hypothetical protein
MLGKSKIWFYRGRYILPARSFVLIRQRFIEMALELAPLLGRFRDKFVDIDEHISRGALVTRDSQQYFRIW